jgi:hypothetical protein
LPLSITSSPSAQRSNALGFAFQSFIDELTHQGAQDPVASRLAPLGQRRVLINSTGKPDGLRDFNTGRMCNMLLKVADVSQ